MKSNSLKGISLGVLLTFVTGVNALADEPVSYKLDVNRVMGGVECTLTDVKTDHPTFDCTLKVKGNKKFALEMKPAAAKKTDGGPVEVKAYYGLDIFSDGKVTKQFFVLADGKKAIQFVNFSDVSFTDHKDIRATVAGAASTVVKAVNVNSVQIKSNDDQSEIKISATFTLYSQDDFLAWNTARGVIPEEVMGQIRPLLYQFLAR